MEKIDELTRIPKYDRDLPIYCQDTEVIDVFRAYQCKECGARYGEACIDPFGHEVCPVCKNEDFYEIEVDENMVDIDDILEKEEANATR